MQLSNVDMRDAFIRLLFERAREDRNIMFLSSEYGAPSLDRFRAELPAQFVNTAISEQNLISVAAGMALGGKNVFCYSIASFITLRCLEQIKIDLCAMNLPVTIIGVGPAYAYSADGPTHHATEDIAIMRALANMQIYSPADSDAAAGLVDTCLGSSGPLYLRLDKGKYPLIRSGDGYPDPGFSLVREGRDVCIIATGMMVHKATEIADQLRASSVDAGVVDLYRLKPVAEELAEVLCGYDRLVSVEEHTINGGLGSIIAEIIVDKGMHNSLRRLGIADDKLYCYGIRDALHQERHIDTGHIVQLILSTV